MADAKKKFFGPGEIVWPLDLDKNGFCISELTLDEAYDTLSRIAESELDISEYNEDGSTLSGTLNIILWDKHFGNKFFRRPIIEILETYWHFTCGEFDETTGLYTEEFDESENELEQARSNRLLLRLLKAAKEWEEKDAKMSIDDMRKNPIE